MLHPRIALSETQKRSLSNGSRKAHSDPTHPPKPVPSAFSVTGTAATPSRAEDALVGNLKQQIQVLELEVKYLKNQGSQRLPTIAELHSPERHHHNTTMGSVGARNNNDELLRRADELEAEVIDLRQQYALREQEHNAEIASLRALIDTENRNAGSHRSLREELERRDAQVKRDVSSMKNLHAQEVVALQSTVERLKIERQNADSNIKFLTEEHAEATKEIVDLRDAGRANTLALDSAQKQLQEAMLHLTQEQGLRRAAEVREVDLKTANEELQRHVSSLKNIESKRDDAAKSHENAIQSRNFEIDQLKLTADRQKEDLARTAAQVVDLKSKLAEGLTKFQELESKLAKAAQGITDVQSEREFFRLQCDRLKVENSVLDVKTQHLEQALSAERVSVTNMERQLCTALDQAEQLRRDARQKEDTYRHMDHLSTTVRVQLRLSEQDRDDLQKRLQEALATLENLNERYAHVKHLEDQKRLEQQLHAALLQLTKSKSEMQNILANQQRVADEFNHVIVDLPDVAHPIREPSVLYQSKTVSPPRTHTLAAGAASSQMLDVEAMSSSANPVQPIASMTVMTADIHVERVSTEDVQRELREITKRIHEEEQRADAVLHH